MPFTRYPDVAVSVPLNALDIANGSVNNAEFQCLNGVTSPIQTQLDGKGAEPLFGYSNGQNITSGSATPITGCTVTVLDDTFYNVDIWVAVLNGVTETGSISTTGTAVFNALLYANVVDVNGTFVLATRPSSFTYTDLAVGELLHITGTIQTTTAGTIILNGLSINAPDAFVIDEARITLTPIGVV